MTPSLAPDEVVRIQLGALARNDSPRLDAGIEITFRFASPDNRKKTGPLPRFIELVKNPVYAPMINHMAVEYGGALEKGDHVLVPVMLTGSDDSKAAYIFVLGQQNVDACKGCWMTESVFRVRVDEAERKSRTIRIARPSVRVIKVDPPACLRINTYRALYPGSAIAVRHVRH